MSSFITGSFESMRERKIMGAREIPRSEFTARLRSTRERAEKAGFDIIVAYSGNRDYKVANVRYLCNWFSTLGASMVIVPVEGEPTLLIEGEWDVPRAREIAAVDDVQASSNFINDLPTLLPKQGKIGIAGWSVFPAPIYERLRAKLPQVRFEDASSLLYTLRMIKSPVEIAVLKEAARITEVAIRKALSICTPGRREWEVLAAGENAARNCGAEISFPSEFGSGPRSAIVCAQPTDKKIRAGETVLMDLGARFRGYHGDLATTIIIGKPSEKQRALLHLDLESLKKAVAAIGPGVKASAVHRAAKNVISKAGYGAYWLHMTG
ncbi:MAG: M24 family metallopeptidase, partial [Candidatus Bathyarchaeia archaeon]